jgi:hypothetical protein
MSTLGPALSNILIQIPVYLVWIAGLIVAVVTWRKHARASLLAVIGLGMFFIQALLGNFLSPWLQQTLARQGVGVRTIRLVLLGRGLLTSLVMMVAWALIIAAVFLPRTAKPDTST